MLSKKMIVLLAGFGLALAASSTVNAAAISCNVQDATAKGEFADLCRADNALSDSKPTTETTFVNAGDLTWGSGFLYVGKYDFDGSAFEGDGAGVTGFTLEVKKDETTVNEITYGFSYTLSATNLDYVGQTISFVLATKQASDIFSAYLWREVTLDIDGTFNSFFVNPGGQTDSAYSHAGAWVRLSDDVLPPLATLPEPATVGLLGLAMLGLAATRRRKSV